MKLYRLDISDDITIIEYDHPDSGSSARHLYYSKTHDYYIEGVIDKPDIKWFKTKFKAINAAYNTNMFELAKSGRKLNKWKAKHKSFYNIHLKLLKLGRHETLKD